MLMLLRTEIKRAAWWLAVCGVLFISVLLAFVWIGLDDLPESLHAVRVVMLSLAGVLFLYHVLRLQKESPARRWMQLPATNRQVALVRLLPPQLFWLVMVTILSLVLLVARPTGFTIEDVWPMLTLSGFVFAAFALPLIVHDLGFIWQSSAAAVGLRILYALLVISGYILYMIFVLEVKPYPFIAPLTDLQVVLRPLAFSATGGLFALLVGVGLSLLSVSVFCRRRSYVR